MKTALSTLFISLLSLSIFAQTNQVQLSGTVIHSDSLTPVPYVNVVNKAQGMGTNANEKGAFSIRTRPGDTLVFSAIGYEMQYYALDKDSRAASPTVQIRLVPKTYELLAVDVYPYPTAEQFKKEFLTMELPDTAAHVNLPKINVPQLTKSIGYLPTGGLAISGPFSALYNKFSKEGKERRQVQALYAQQTRKQLYDSRFNADIVRRVTGLKDKELEDFMQYCKLSESKVIDADNEYEIVLAINDCYKSFKEERNR